VLRNGGGRNLHEYLIETAARLIEQRGSAGLGVRDIAREAQVADGVLYNYFEDKEDLLAQALLVHVGSVMSSMPPLPPPGAGTLEENLRLFVDRGLAVLTRVMPAFAGLSSQPKVLQRFHALVGGDAAFGTATEEQDEPQPDPPERPIDADAGPGPQGLPSILTTYLRAEQRLGRVSAAADVDAASTLIVGAIHGQILPGAMLRPGEPVTIPPDFSERMVKTVLHGIAP
jgi:AcrR family transcriptional regulator